MSRPIAARPGRAPLRAPLSTGLAGLVVLCGLVASCGNGSSPGSGESSATAERPNILFVVWDTVRRDRIGLYGAERDTTPFLDGHAKDGLVFDDCRSVAPSTVPSHGSMFTGLFPAEHGANHLNRWLPGGNETLAELLQRAGYGTFLFSSNPNISAMENFGQGFETELHLWDDAFRDRAIENMAGRLTAPDGSPVGGEGGRAQRVKDAAIAAYEIKGCGGLINEGFLGWIDEQQAEAPEQPWFGFLNYMEAHYPLQPAAEYRERFLEGEALAASYSMDRSERRLWRHVFGAERLSEPELEVMHAVYDAAMAELDALFADLIGQLEARGALENTLVVLVSDHGEHLGEHELFDHRYSLFDELVRLPLVMWWPGRLEAGRTDKPVSNQDLFLTMLEAADVAPPPVLHDRLDDPAAGMSLLDPAALPAERARFASYLNDFGVLTSVLGPGDEPVDPRRFQRELDVLVHEDWKLTEAPGGLEPPRLIDLAGDPAEAQPAQDATALAELGAQLAAWREALQAAPPSDKDGIDPRELADQEARLGAIGYGDD